MTERLLNMLRARLLNVFSKPLAALPGLSEGLPRVLVEGYHGNYCAHSQIAMRAVPEYQLIFLVMHEFNVILIDDQWTARLLKMLCARTH